MRLADIAHKFCNAIDPKIPIDPPAAEKGYIVTNYLKPDSSEYDGININNLKYFNGVTCYVKANNKGVWIEMQYLSLSKCQELKSTLGKWFF